MVEHKFFNNSDGKIQCEFCKGIYEETLLPECYGRTTVVHCKRSRYDVLIDRTSKWGNPFIVGKDGTREEVVIKYAKWVVNQPILLRGIHKLKGKRLGCWCFPRLCHGHVLQYLLEGLGLFAELLETRGT